MVYTPRGSCLHLKKSQKAGETGWQEPPAVTQGIEQWRGAAVGPPACWKAAFLQRPRGSWKAQSWMWARTVPLWQEGSWLWATLGRELPSDWEMWSFPSAQHWWSHVWSSVPRTTETHNSWKELRIGPLI